VTIARWQFSTVSFDVIWSIYFRRFAFGLLKHCVIAKGGVWLRVRSPAGRYGFGLNDGTERRAVIGPPSSLAGEDGQIAHPT
jgi:hypothetical protein